MEDVRAMGSRIYNGFASHVKARTEQLAAAARRRGESVPATPTTTTPARPTAWTSALNAFNRTVQGANFIDKANQFAQAVRSGDQSAIGNTGMGWIGNTAETVSDLYDCSPFHAVFSYADVRALMPVYMCVRVCGREHVRA